MIEVFISGMLRHARARVLKMRYIFTTSHHRNITNHMTSLRLSTCLTATAVELGRRLLRLLALFFQQEETTGRTCIAVSKHIAQTYHTHDEHLSTLASTLLSFQPSFLAERNYMYVHSS